MKGWERTRTHEVGDFGVFSLHRDHLLNPRTGCEYPFFVVRTGDWVNVIAITADDQVVLVRQARAGIAGVTVEIPGGRVDPGEDPAAAALRELSEETGFTGSVALPIGRVHPNPALFDNVCHTFVVRDARRTTVQALDPGEDIEVLTRPLREIPDLIADGTITHALVVAAFSHLSRVSAGTVDR